MRLRTSLLAAALVLGGMTVVAGPASFACAGEGPDATLVVDTGGGEYKYCIALDAKSVSGLHLIELASQQHGLSYSLGYQGQAVCMLAGVGSQEEECFHGGEPFWGYWRGTSSGGWSWSGSGAGSTAVSDGDVEGWSWGTGNDGNSHQAPPNTTHAEVCGPETAPDEGNTERPDKKGKDKGSDRSGGGQKRSGGGAGDNPAAPGTTEPAAGSSATSGDLTGEGDDDGDGSAAGRARKRSKEDSKARAGNRTRRSTPRTETGTVAPPTSVTGTPDPTPVAASSGGPPAAGIVGLVLTILLALAGVWFTKRKRASIH